MDPARIATWLSEPVGRVGSVQRIAGGDTAQSLRVATSAGDVFLKVTDARSADALAAEATGLRLLAGADAVRVPGVVACGHDAEYAWLALEWLELRRASTRAAERLGRGLALVHRVGAATFGLDHDNAIGASVQRNTPTASWPDFFARCRLGVQCELADGNASTQSLVAPLRELMTAVPALLRGADPAPALLHGDLWGGNWAALGDDDAAVFDPAVYYGDRETDVAMTELFGGFPDAFYAAYRETWPLDDGYAQRRPLYNLYHVLNHANLFGGGYVGQAQRGIRGLLAAARSSTA